MIDHGTVHVLKPKPASKWVAHLTPGGYVRFNPPEGDVPCWFHRQMQRVWLGVVWKRLP